jgi:predicted phage tail protein
MEKFCIMHDEDIKTLREDMAANDKEHESFRRRLHEHDEQINAIHTLATSVEKLADAMNETKKTVEKIDRRVEDIEREPADKWKKITFEVVKAIVVALVGAALMYFGIK